MTLTMAEWEKIVLAFQYMCEKEPKLSTYIHPEVRVQLSDYKAKSYPEDGVLIDDREPERRSLSHVEEEIFL